MNDFLKIELDDRACPAFCSFSKPYFGTEKDINVFIEEYKKSRLQFSEREKQRLESNLCDLYNFERQLKFDGKTKEDVIEELKSRTQNRSVIQSTEMLFQEDGLLNNEIMDRRYKSFASSLAVELHKLTYDQGFYDGAWREYKEGNHNAKAVVAMCKRTFVEECEICAELSFDRNDEEATVANIYDFETKLRWDKAHFDVRWVRTFEEHGGNQQGEGCERVPAYFRIMKIGFCGIQRYSEYADFWSFPGSMVWGIHGILICNSTEHDEENRALKGDISTRLWIIDKYFEDEKSFLEDIASHASKDEVNIDLSNFYQEIVADG